METPGPPRRRGVGAWSRTARRWTGVAAGVAALLSGIALAVLGVRGLRFLPAQGAAAPPSTPQQLALLGGLALIAAVPVAITVVCLDRAAVRVGLAASAIGIVGGVVLAIAFSFDDLLPPTVFGLGVAAAVALPARGWRALLAKVGAAAACAVYSVLLSDAGWFDPLVVLVLPLVAAVDAWVDRAGGSSRAEA